MQRLDPFEKGLIALLPKLRVQALSLTGEDTSAEDLVQKTCLKAWEAKDSFTPFGHVPYQTALRSWTGSILHYTYVSDHQRPVHATRVEPLLNTTKLPDSYISVRPRQDDIVELRQVVRRLGRLSPVQRRTLSRVVFHGDSMPAIATEENIPLGTVKSRLLRSRQSLEGLKPPATRSFAAGRPAP